MPTGSPDHTRSTTSRCGAEPRCRGNGYQSSATIVVRHANRWCPLPTGDLQTAAGRLKNAGLPKNRRIAKRQEFRRNSPRHNEVMGWVVGCRSVSPFFQKLRLVSTVMPMMKLKSSSVAYARSSRISYGCALSTVQGNAFPETMQNPVSHPPPPI